MTPVLHVSCILQGKTVYGVLILYTTTLTVPLDVGPRLPNEAHSSLCNKSFSVANHNWQLSKSDPQQSSLSQTARQMPGPNIDCTGKVNTNLKH